MITKSKRKEYFAYLKLGEYNAENILKLQKKYFAHYTGENKEKDNWDKKYGSDTDKLLVNLYRVTRYAPHFTLGEFRCKCGSKYCTGYPAYISIQLLKNLEAVRTKFKDPVNVSSGLRCKEWNKRQSGSASQSRHMSGQAADIYGTFTSTDAKRNKVKAYWYQLSDANYCYHGTSNMGTAIHVDVK